MYRFFIRHKLSISDITHLSDTDSDFALNKLNIKIEDIIEIETYEAIFLARVTEISENSVEVEIVEKTETKEIIDSFDITIIQSLSHRSKFNYFLEKAVEIGVNRIIPIQSQYSLVDRNKALKEYGLWQKIIKDALEQSRNIKPTVIEKPIKIKDLKIVNIPNRICLATENIKSKSLRKYFENININKSFVIAIGPEKGWSRKDIEVFNSLNFNFVKLEGNILRTETTSLVITSIVKYLKGEM